LDLRGPVLAINIGVMSPADSFEVLADAVIGQLVWLESLPDDVLDADAAVAATEDLTAALRSLAPADQGRVAARAFALAATERRSDVAELLRCLPSACGLNGFD